MQWQYPRPSAEFWDSEGKLLMLGSLRQGTEPLYHGLPAIPLFPCHLQNEFKMFDSRTIRKRSWIKHSSKDKLKRFCLVFGFCVWGSWTFWWLEDGFQASQDQHQARKKMKRRPMVLRRGNLKPKGTQEFPLHLLWLGIEGSNFQSWRLWKDSWGCELFRTSFWGSFGHQGHTAEVEDLPNPPWPCSTLGSTVYLAKPRNCEDKQWHLLDFHFWPCRICWGCLHTSGLFPLPLPLPRASEQFRAC